MVTLRVLLGQTVVCALLVSVLCEPAEAQTLGRVTFATGVTDREPTDSLDSRPTGLDRGFFFTEILDSAGRQLTHQWLIDGQVVYELAVRVGGDRWRVWSSKRLAGATVVTVRVVDDTGSVIVEGTFGNNGTTITRLETSEIEVNVFQEFRYVPRGWPLGLSVGQTPAGGLSWAAMELLVREPQYHSQGMMYGYLPLSDGEDTRITFVVDELEASNWIVWIDRNNNEDLTDDGAPCRNEGTGRFACLFSVEMNVNDQSGIEFQAPYQLWLWLAGLDEPVDFGSSRIPWRAFFYTRHYYAGVVMLAGTGYLAIAYEMFNHDVFDAEDTCVDLDDDNRCADAERAVRRQPVSGRLVVSDQGQGVMVRKSSPGQGTIPPSGTSMRIMPS